MADELHAAISAGGAVVVCFGAAAGALPEGVEAGVLTAEAAAGAAFGVEATPAFQAYRDGALLGTAHAWDEAVVLLGGAPPAAAEPLDGGAAAEPMDGVEATPEMVLPPVDDNLLQQLLGMDFPEVRARKALLNASTLDAAISWIVDHQDDADIDEAIPLVPAGAGAAAGAPQSLKCGDCGAILRDMVAAEMHANKTGHANFEESTVAITPLTPEEKAAKLEQIKAQLAARRVQREEEERKENIQREKLRRMQGQQMAKTAEEREQMQRKRDAEMRRREKLEAKRERERLRAEIARDKEERRRNKGTLGSRLGVDGYRPAAPSLGAEGAAPAAGAGAEAAAAEPPPAGLPAESQLQDCVDKLALYRAGGDGGTAMRTLLAYVNNLITRPEEPKFRSINMDNANFKRRVGSLKGGLGFLRAIGYRRDPLTNRLELAVEDRDEARLQRAKEVLEGGMAAYG